jgi:hypothetical protein
MSQHAVIDPNATRRRAHELWQERGCPMGSSESDWLEAERELAVSPSTQADSATAAPSKPFSLIEGAAGADPVVAAVPRLRRARSILTRATPTPASMLLVALVPNAAREAHVSSAPARARVAPRR